MSDHLHIIESLTDFECHFTKELKNHGLPYDISGCAYVITPVGVRFSASLYPVEKDQEELTVEVAYNEFSCIHLPGYSLEHVNKLYFTTHLLLPGPCWRLQLIYKRNTPTLAI